MSRLFFALWPDNITRHRIDAIVRNLPVNQGRRVTPENIHITLAFLGQIDSERNKQLISKASNVSCQGFQLNLDRIGWWKKPQIVWLAPSFIPDELTALVNQVEDIATSCNIKLENRSCQPHMTIMRKVRRSIPEQLLQPIDWQVNCFALIESITHPEGVRYTLQQSWPLM